MKVKKWRIREGYEQERSKEHLKELMSSKSQSKQQDIGKEL